MSWVEGFRAFRGLGCMLVYSFFFGGGALVFFGCVGTGVLCVAKWLSPIPESPGRERGTSCLEDLLFGAWVLVGSVGYSTAARK